MRWRAISLREWHLRFAWLPVYIEGQGIWLERYERRLLWSDLWCDSWEYRLPHPTPSESPPRAYAPEMQREDDDGTRS